MENQQPSDVSNTHYPQLARLSLLLTLRKIHIQIHPLFLRFTSFNKLTEIPVNFKKHY